MHWVNAFAFILLPGALIGASMGWAELRRRRGGRPQWRLVLAPFLFAAVLVSDPLHIGELFQDGIGGGTVGVPAIALAAIVFTLIQPRIRNCPQNAARWIRQGATAGIASLLALVM